MCVCVSLRITQLVAFGLDSSGSRLVLVVGACEGGNELSGFRETSCLLWTSSLWMLLCRAT